MIRATVSSVRSRPRSSSSRLSGDEESQYPNAPPPMEPSMICMSVVENGPSIAFACFNEERNEILLETCLASGCDTEGIVQRFLQNARPNLVLLGNKIINNAGLLEMVTRSPPPLPGDSEGEATEESRGNSDRGIAQGQGREQRDSTTSSSSSLPYKLLKSGSFDFRSCKALILQKLRVLSLIKQRAQEYCSGYDDPNRNIRQFPLSKSCAVFRPSSYHSLAALIDFDSKVQVQALGSLLSFLQSTVFRLEEAGTITVNRIVYAKSSKYMYIPATTFEALHIFAIEHHPLNAAKGQGNSKEGWSLFSLLDRTQSKGGRQMLRDWMRKPLVDLKSIAARHDVVELFMHQNLQASVGVLINFLGKVGPVDKILTRLQKCSTQTSDFLVLMKTLSAVFAIGNTLRNEILPRLDSQGDNQSHHFLLNIATRCNAPILFDLQERMASTIDEEATRELKTSIVIRYGFHEQLDDWKEQFEYLEGKATIAMQEPEYNSNMVLIFPSLKIHSKK